MSRHGKRSSVREILRRRKGSRGVPRAAQFGVYNGPLVTDTARMSAGWLQTHHNLLGCGHRNEAHGDYGECGDCLAMIPPGPCTGESQDEAWVLPTATE